MNVVFTVGPINTDVSSVDVLIQDGILELQLVMQLGRLLLMAKRFLLAQPVLCTWILWREKHRVGRSDMVVDIECRPVHGRLPPCVPGLKLSLSPPLQHRLPINPNAADGTEVVVVMRSSLAAAEHDR